MKGGAYYMAHIHDVIDTDKHFIIDAVSMAIQNTSDKVKLSQYNHKSERFTFEIPRYIDGHDMSLCNKVQVHFNNVKSDKTATSKGVYEVDDLEVAEDENTVLFTWLISRKATLNEGTLNFCIRFACVAEDATVEYARYTDIYKGITISESLFNSEQIIADYSDILEAWKKELLEEISTSGVGVSSWNDLEDKPFGDEGKHFDEVTFDGIINENSIITNTDTTNGCELYYVKVGELPYTSEEYLSVADMVCAEYAGTKLSFSNEDFKFITNSPYSAEITKTFGVLDLPLVVAVDIPGIVSLHLKNISFPETGLYFMVQRIDGVEAYVEKITFEGVKRINEKYMPATYADIKKAIEQLEEDIKNAKPKDYDTLKADFDVIKAYFDSIRLTITSEKYNSLTSKVGTIENDLDIAETQIRLLQEASVKHMENVPVGSEGAFMRVQNGKWDSATLAIAEESEY